MLHQTWQETLHALDHMQLLNLVATSCHLPAWLDDQCTTGNVMSLSLWCGASDPAWPPKLWTSLPLRNLACLKRFYHKKVCPGSTP